MLVYCLPILSSTWNTIDTKMLNYVSEERSEKVLHYHFDIDRKLSLYSALLTRMGLSILSGIPAENLKFHRQINFKPYLISSPEYHFNISHTRNFILCCVSDSCPVGVDTEENTSAPLTIMNTVYHPVEKEYVLSSICASIRNSRFFKIWTQKEAYTKYLGTGITNSLTNVNTLDPLFASNFYTWNQEKYTCSVFTPLLKTIQVKTLSEIEVQSYYLGEFEIVNN